MYDIDPTKHKDHLVWNYNEWRPNLASLQAAVFLYFSIYTMYWFSRQFSSYVFIKKFSPKERLGVSSLIEFEMRQFSMVVLVELCLYD